MYLTRSEYDRDVNTFSREGRLFQVEYAIQAIKVNWMPGRVGRAWGCLVLRELARLDARLFFFSFCVSSSLFFFFSPFFHPCVAWVDCGGRQDVRGCGVGRGKAGDEPADGGLEH
jgi:hypothetical protein